MKYRCFPVVAFFEFTPGFADIDGRDQRKQVKLVAGVGKGIVDLPDQVLYLGRSQHFEVRRRKASVKPYKLKECFLQRLPKHFPQFTRKQWIWLLCVEVDIDGLDLEPDHLASDLFGVPPRQQLVKSRGCDHFSFFNGCRYLGIADFSL